MRHNILVETENKLSTFGKIYPGDDMPQATKSNLLLYADDSCLMYQFKNIAKIEKIFNKDFENIGFVGNK